LVAILVVDDIHRVVATTAAKNVLVDSRTVINNKDGIDDR
jgi:hypothetical protein